MAADEKWYFTKEQLANTPSRRCGIDADKELSFRQQAANFIQDMGQRLVVTQLCINTAIVYMHRFYVFHSLSQFHRNAIAAAALFLAAKVEEQPRKLEHVIKVAHMCLHRDQNTPDPKSDQYLEQAQDLVFNENVLLQTLGFDVAIDHPHTHVVRCCQLVKASKDLAQTSYFMASNSLHLTTMCLQYKPTVVACFCIHLACKWSNWEIPQSNEGKYWFWYVDRTVTAELLQQLTAEFLHIFDRCPSRLKKKIMSISEKQSPSMHHPSLPNSPFDIEPRKVNSPAPDGGPTFQSSRPFPQEKDEKKPSTSGQSRLPQLDAREYREKKERERLEREKLSGGSLPQISHSNADPQKHHSHHHKGPTSSTLNPLIPGKHPPSLPQKSNPHHSHHHRPDPKLVQQQTAQRHPQSRQRPPPPVQPGIPYNPHSHSNPQNHQKDMNSMMDTSASSSDLAQPHQEPQAHQPLDKSGNNNHSLHRRAYDPRHKLMEHRKEEPKNYQKYGDQMRVDRQRKPDSLEQRSEEVRKLIEKPLPPPKPRPEQSHHHQQQQQPQQPQQSLQQSAQSQKEDYAVAMLKQSSHHPSKYHEKMPIHNTGRNALPPDFSKFPVPHKQQQQPPSGLLGHSQSVQNLPKDLKNGTIEDVKCEKRPRLESDNPIPSLPVKHKSLFSPEKVTPSRELTIPSRTKLTKQKTPPMVQVKAIKQERNPEVSGTLDFTSSTLSTSPQTLQAQRRPKIPDISVTEPDAGQMRLKMEDPGNFDIMKMFGKIPEPTMSIRDIPGSTNGRGPTAGQLNEHLKSSNKSDSSDSKHTLTNGLESLGFRNEVAHHVILDKLDSGPIKTEYLSPMKSVQGISALLQEPLAPMPSLLSQSSDSGNFSQSFGQASLTQNSESIHQSSEPRTGPLVKEEFAASTVDISALSGPGQVLPEISAPSNPSLQHPEKKSEHHKSEKKKKKEKHKHKDKDKSKEKHKHKHKDKEKDKDKDKEKEKDKERDKDKHKEKSQKSEENSASPIKITIPKDKLNLSTENSSNQERKSPSGGKLTLKIPKDRLKHETSVQPVAKDIQGSLKIKIRTSGGGVEFTDSRKRERERENLDGVPAAKKSTSGNQGFPGQQQRTTERQNGRHYGSGSNKEKHSREHKSSSKLSQSQQSHAT